MAESDNQAGRGPRGGLGKRDERSGRDEQSGRDDAGAWSGDATARGKGSGPHRPERMAVESYRDDYYADEISLRDLYLILRRGLPFIIGIALVAGVVGFVGASLRPKTYEAEATVLSSPSAVRVREEGTLAFEPANSVSFEAYETIAMSRAVFEEVASTLAGAPGAPASYRDLQAAADLEKLTGPDRAGQVVPLTVLHTVSWGDPETAAAYANAWAGVSVETMRRTLLASLDPVQEATSTSTATRLDRLEAIEARWEEFQARDNTGELEASLTELQREIAEGERRLNELSVAVRVEETRREALQAQLADLEATTASLDPSSDAYLAGNDLATARQLISAQLSEAEQRRAEAQAALDAFDSEHATAPLEAELDFLLGRSAEPIAEFRASATPSSATETEPSVHSTAIQVVSGGFENQTAALPALRERLRSMPGKIAAAEARAAAAGQSNVAPTSAGPTSADAQTDLAALRAEEQALRDQVAATEAYLADIRSQLVPLRGERSRLSAVLAAASDRYDLLLQRSRQLSDDAAGERFLRDVSTEAVRLRDSARASELGLAALRIEQDALAAQLDRTRQETTSFRGEMSSLVRERARLEREMQLAENAYLSVAQLEPLIGYVTELTPTSTRLINKAAVPVSPSGPSSTLVAVLALVLGGMLATLFVFLREAVRSPDSREPDGSPKTPEGAAPAGW